MSNTSPAMSAWNKFSVLPGGKSLFSRFLCWKAPYFSSISPRFIELRPGYCKIAVKKRRKVQNHLGTVHAIAMCNMAELAGGTMTDVSIPSTHRWIPKGMTVEYLAKAETDLHAIATIDPIPKFEQSSELPVTVNVFDSTDQNVFRAIITMWVSRKSK